MNNFKVLLPQQIHEEGMEILKNNGMEIVIPPSEDKQTILNSVKD